MKKFWLLSAVGLIFSLISFNKTSFVEAATSSSGLSVSPAITEQTLNASQDELTLDETIINISNQPLVINARPQDFGSIGSAGTINFYSPTSYKPASNPHGLQNSVQLSAKQFDLLPSTSFVEQVSIVKTQYLAAGGHYGAVVYTPKPILSVGGTAKVGLTPSVASLIFLTTASGGTQHLNVSNILQSSLSLSLPKTVSFIMANSGNTQATPIGYVKLIGSGNKLVAQNDLNNTSTLVLPSSSILMNVSLATHSNFFTESGIYHLKIYYGDASTDKLVSVTRSFLYLNLPLLLVQIVCLLIVIWLARYITRFLIRRRRHEQHRNQVE